MICCYTTKPLLYCISFVSLIQILWYFSFAIFLLHITPQNVCQYSTVIVIVVSILCIYPPYISTEIHISNGNKYRPIRQLTISIDIPPQYLPIHILPVYGTWYIGYCNTSLLERFIYSIITIFFVPSLLLFTKILDNVYPDTDVHYCIHYL